MVSFLDFGKKLPKIVIQTSHSDICRNPFLSQNSTKKISFGTLCKFKMFPEFDSEKDIFEVVL